MALYVESALLQRAPEKALTSKAQSERARVLQAKQRVHSQGSNFSSRMIAPTRAVKSASINTREVIVKMNTSTILSRAQVREYTRSIKQSLWSLMDMILITLLIKMFHYSQ